MDGQVDPSGGDVSDSGDVRISAMIPLSASKLENYCINSLAFEA